MIAGQAFAMGGFVVVQAPDPPKKRSHPTSEGGAGAPPSELQILSPEPE